MYLLYKIHDDKKVNPQIFCVYQIINNNIYTKDTNSEMFVTSY